MSRAWKKESKHHWRCAPWTVALCFIDGHSMYVLSKDGEERAVAYCECLEDALKKAKELEAA